MQKTHKRCNENQMIVLEKWTVIVGHVFPNLEHKWFFYYFKLISFYHSSYLLNNLLLVSLDIHWKDKDLILRPLVPMVWYPCHYIAVVVHFPLHQTHDDKQFKQKKWNGN